MLRKSAKTQVADDEASSSTSRTQVQRREESVARMVQAAVELIVERGVASMTMAEVGVRAGYSRGLAHTHFKTKEKLLQDCLYYLAEQFNVLRRKKFPNAEGVEWLYSLIDTYTERPEGSMVNARAMAILLGEAAHSDSPLYSIVREYNQKNIEFVEENIKIAVRAGDIKREIDTQIAAAIFMSLLRGYSIYRMNDGAANAQAMHAEMNALLECWLLK